MTACIRVAENVQGEWCLFLAVLLTLFRLFARLRAEGFRSFALLVSFLGQCLEALGPIDFVGTGRVDPPCSAVNDRCR